MPPRQLMCPDMVCVCVGGVTVSVQSKLCLCVCAPVFSLLRNECVTTKVCVPGMECVCAPMVCECASGMQCASV